MSTDQELVASPPEGTRSEYAAFALAGAAATAGRAPLAAGAGCTSPAVQPAEPCRGRRGAAPAGAAFAPADPAATGLVAQV